MPARYLLHKTSASELALLGSHSADHWRLLPRMARLLHMDKHDRQQVN
jgi:hypothetical protein